MTHHFRAPFVLIFLLFSLPGAGGALAADLEAEWSDPAVNDAPLSDELTYPDWFKLSFLDLREDLRDAGEAGKQGLIIYFGQKHCPYCKALLENDFGRSDIARYTRKHFDLVAIDVYGDRTVTGFDGTVMTEKEYAEWEDASLTPALLFFDTKGKEALRLVGYHPPYEFRAALEYVADGHYRNETLRRFLARANEPQAAAHGNGLNKDPFFAPGPHNLDRSRWRGERPLAVFFEQGDCYACDVLHFGPLLEPDIRERLKSFDSVQLDMWADAPVVTPAGERTTSRAWAERLGLFYTPTLIFYDDQGKEIIRVDSVAGFYRLRRVLDYVLSGAHKKGLSLQAWRRQQGGD